MPSPVGHSLMGYIIYRATAKPVAGQRWQRLALYLFAANAADLDFIPGFLVGDPNRYHHGISHSLGGAVLFAAVFSLLWALLKRPAIARHFGIFFALYASHLLLDWCSIDTSFPHGVPFLWPLREDYAIAPFAFWPDIRRSHFSTDFVASLFSRHNLWAVSVEVLVLLPLLVLLLASRKLATGSTKRNHGPDTHKTGRSLKDGF